MIHHNDFIVIDIETGGLKTDGSSPITEFGIVVLDWELNYAGEYCKIVCPYNKDHKYEAKALEYSKLTMSDINGGTDSNIVVGEIIDLFKQSKKRTGKKPILCGHNVQSFDIPFIYHFFLYHKKDLWSFVEGYCIDTMWFARWKYKESDNFKLGTVCSNEGIALGDAHTALGDVQSNSELVKIFLKLLRGEGGKINKNEEKRFRTAFQF